MAQHPNTPWNETVPSWHIPWNSIWQIFWQSIWNTFWQFFWHSTWHMLCHSIWHWHIKPGNKSGTLSDIYCAIPSDIYSGKISDILSGIYPSVLSGILSDIYPGIPSHILSDIGAILFGILSGIFRALCLAPCLTHIVPLHTFWQKFGHYIWHIS